MTEPTTTEIAEWLQNVDFSEGLELLNDNSAYKRFVVRVYMGLLLDRLEALEDKLEAAEAKLAAQEKLAWGVSLPKITKELDDEFGDTCLMDEDGWSQIAV